MRNKPIFVFCLTPLLFSPIALASDLTGLIAIFVPGLVFLVVGSFAVSYALTCDIEHYWLKFILRIFSIAFILSPVPINGTNYWCPNGIALFFYQQINFFNVIANTLITTLIFTLMWWLVRSRLKFK